MEVPGQRQDCDPGWLRRFPRAYWRAGASPTVVNQPWGLDPRASGNGSDGDLRQSVCVPRAAFHATCFHTLRSPSPGSSLSPFTFNYNWRPALIQRFSLNVQTEITKSLMLEIGYIGTRGLHLSRRHFQIRLSTQPTHSIRGQTDNTLANLFQRVPVQGFSIAAGDKSTRRVPPGTTRWKLA